MTPTSGLTSAGRHLICLASDLMSDAPKVRLYGTFLSGLRQVPSLALAAEDMTNFIIWEIDRTGPLCLGKGPFFGDKDVGTGPAEALCIILKAVLS